MIHLFLFDVDGVLVEARGYLKALQDTVAHFSCRMGVGDHPPTEEEVRGFEANGLTSEWDSAPACVAVLLLERLRREPSFPLPADWPDALAALAASPCPLPRPDYGLLARRVGERLPEWTGPAQVRRPFALVQADPVPGRRPGPVGASGRLGLPRRYGPQGGEDTLTGDGARLCASPATPRRDGETHAGPAQAARAVLWDEAQTIRGLGHSQAAVAALLDTLLGRSNDFYRAPVTRHFQHLAIGSRAIAETYGVAPDFNSEAYLQRFDRPLLRPEVRDGLKEMTEGGPIRVALYTARPSLPPLHTDEPLTGYSPEAEMARSLVGLEAWPVIGRGKVRWLARQAGEDLERLVKPSPVQALAAIGAAWSGQEIAALQAALALLREGSLRPPLAGMGPATVHVFEDSHSGLEAVARAVEPLQAAGIPVAWQPYGIAPAHGSKAAALSARGVPVYPSVNEAVLAVLSRL